MLGRGAAIAFYVGVLVGVGVVFATTIPNWWLLLAAVFIAGHITLGLVMGDGPWLLAPLTLVVVLGGVAIAQANPLIVVWGIPIVTASGYAAMWIGTAIRRHR